MATTVAPMEFSVRWFGADLKKSAEFAVMALILAFATPTEGSLWVGAGVTLAGELLRIWTAGYGYKEGELYVKGPYRFLRHPYLLGSGLFFLGFCLVGRDPWVTAIGMLLLVLVYRRDVEIDEKIQKKVLGPDFEEFSQRVPGYLPAMIPETALIKDERRFSFKYSMIMGRYRELSGILTILGGFGILYLLSRFPENFYFKVGVLSMVGLYVFGRFCLYGLLKRR